MYGMNNIKFVLVCFVTVAILCNFFITSFYNFLIQAITLYYSVNFGGEFEDK